VSEIHYVIGDATRPSERPAIIVHCCNDKGLWGKGFVVALSKRWTEPELAYRRWWNSSKEDLGGDYPPFRLGEAQLVQVERNMWVANLIGQCGIRSSANRIPIRYDAIAHGLLRVANWAGPPLGASVAMPRIGCGLAGGDWNVIEEIINETLVVNDIDVYIYDLPS